MVPQWRQAHVSTSALQSFRPGKHHDAIRAVGAANGTMDLAGCLAEGYAAGEAAAKAHAGRARGRAKAEAAARKTPLEPIWFAPATGKYNEGNKHFIDFQNDVTAADLELAQREGYASVEHTKRYTTFGMATDQGKTSNINGLGVLAEATGKTIPEIGITTFRPPYTPFSFGSIAGRADQGAVPARSAARRSIDWHKAQNAPLRAGRPMAARLYLSAGRRGQACGRSTAKSSAVRNKVGLLDASTLGKIEIKGPDAADFLDRIYTNMFSTLKVGRCRYGLMMNELGFLIDDGVTVRLADDHFLMHTTSGGADRIAAWLEEWLQTEWTHYKVFVTPVTEQWAQFAIAGPKAREVLAKLAPDFDISARGLPAYVDEGRQARLTIRCASIASASRASFPTKWRRPPISAAACGMRSSPPAPNSASRPMAPRRCMCCAPRKAISSSAMRPTAR